MKKQLVIHLLIAFVCTTACASNYQTTVNAFIDRINFWHSLDSTEQRAELTRLESIFRSSDCTDLDVLVWAEAIVLVEEQDLWNETAEEMRLKFLRMPTDEFAALSHFNLLKHIYSSEFKDPPFHPEFDQHEFAWKVFRAQLLSNIANETSLLNSILDAVPPPRPPSFKTQFWAFGGGFFTLFAFLLFLQEWRKRTSNMPDSETDMSQKDDLELNRFLGRKRDVRLVIELDRLEWKLGMSPLQTHLGSNSKWSKLNSSQTLLMHLLYRGHSVEEYAEFLGLSRGHVYNQRSKIRTILALSEEEDLISHIRNVVERQSN